MTSAVMPTYARLPVAFVRGEGAWLWDTEGRRYLDALAGIAVCNLGHAHPRLAQVLCDQAKRLWHTSNLYRIELQEQLAAELTRLAAMDNVFFCNSGAEANEAAIKLARAYGHRRGIATPKIVVMEGSFHGRTLATLSATGNPRVRQGFEPLVAGFVHCPFGQAEAVAALADDPDIVAVLVEPVQGEGGVRVPPADYLARLRRLCDRHGWLLMLDEVQTGIGRCGHWFAHQRTGIVPDVMTLAKALGNGFPIGACLARGEAAEVLQAGMHGSTFGGNFLACRVALEVLHIIEAEDLLPRAQTLGRQLAAGFRERLGDFPGIRDIRHQGLMLGIELDRPCGMLVSQALAAGVLINVTATSVVRLLPPLILDDDQAGQLLDTLSTLIVNTLDKP
ncbi:acetylornithine/N-succinyldiaminopimelate aminotransferase [Methylomarinovum caldicuralii]|uniref:Acetylornithine aminotransferase n=1 Tax=Methylomarinovum caldicuralii TaxID=438856 RepID=A0AAU9CHT7_9GAMM|nr:acetylornithine transaminase [Methylomarinovum caldicuralii]BCX82565.1 acetylornithine/N-succinyldiaminopimelate aminotransferase [Methylomarinovum caldicuralii]